MKHPLCLDFLTAIEAAPPELATLAAANGCESISILVHPSPGVPDYGMNIDSPTRRETLSRCRDLGIAIDMIEGFFLTPETDVEAYRASLESGGTLGARSVNVLLRDTDRSRLTDNLAAFCELACTFDVATVTEWSIRSPFPSPAEAAAFLENIGRPATLAFDSLHLFRGGFSAADIAGLDASIVGRGQLADGPAEMPADKIMAEAFSERLPPGEGALPLASFVGALSRGVVIGLEVPMESKRLQGIAAAERVRSVVGAARSLIPSPV
jgi:sugar phosphate isomerase/epimerase